MCCEMSKVLNILIGGGGTGGHIFPALAMAQSIKSRRPDARILFLGAEGRMEMTKVPEAGFEIIGLPIAGLQRKLDVQNLLLPIKVFRSLLKTIELIRTFKPDVAIGVGGYASAPLILASWVLGIPYLIQEQNSFAGLTNKLLSRKAKSICVAFEGMDRYFPKKKIHLTGNPVRTDLLANNLTQLEGQLHFGLKPGLPTILVIGGSLGAKTINESVLQSLEEWKSQGFQLIWQTGKTFEPKANEAVNKIGGTGMVVFPFLKEMNYAYCAADLVVSRAGALSLAEICICGKPSILIPSPNVAEDHQTHNAQTLVSKNAARLIPDKAAREKLGSMVTELLHDPNQLEIMAMEAHNLAKPKATQTIVNQIFEIAKA